MRHVLASEAVAHAWAHQTQASARNARSSDLFRCGVIYSYGEHFPIARHTQNKAGESAVLFTTGRHSVTTSGHCSMVRGAVRHLTVFDVPNVYANIKGEHEGNLLDYAKRISAYLLKAARARVNKDWDHSQALKLREEAIKYAKFFRVPYAKTLPTVPALGSVQLQAIKDAENKRQAAERKRIMRESAEAIAQWRAGEYARLPY